MAEGKGPLHIAVPPWALPAVLAVITSVGGGAVGGVVGGAVDPADLRGVQADVDVMGAHLGGRMDAVASQVRELQTEVRALRVEGGAHASQYAALEARIRSCEAGTTMTRP